MEPKKNETALQSVIDKFNERLKQHEANGYSTKVGDNLAVAAEFREGLFESYYDPDCLDKEDIKYEILEFTKIIIRLNNVAQKHFNPQVTMPSVEEQLADGIETEEQLKRIFKTKK